MIEWLQADSDEEAMHIAPQISINRCKERQTKKDGRCQRLLLRPALPILVNIGAALVKCLPKIRDARV